MAAQVTYVSAITSGAGTGLRRQKGFSSACSFSTAMLPTSLAMLLELHFLPKEGSHPGITLLICQVMDATVRCPLAAKGFEAAAANQALLQNLAPLTLSEPLNTIQMCQQRSWHRPAAIPLSWPATPLPGSGNAPCLHIWASLLAAGGPGSLHTSVAEDEL